METLSQKYKRMSHIHSNNSKIEVIMRKALWHRNIRYRKHYKILNCRPDIVITKHKIAIFCDGEFWHGRYNDGSQVNYNHNFWQNKIKRNIERDLENTIMLRDNGWTVLRFWESDINVNLEKCIEDVLNHIKLKQPKK